MFSALQTPEIQNIIFDHFTKEDQPTLLALALSCRTFFETACDLLWQEQWSLQPLLKTASARGDLWEVDNRCILKFLRPVREDDWSKWESYATRIRSLQITAHDVSVDVLAVLNTYRPGQVLLKSLHSFEITLGDFFPYAALEYIPPLLNPCLGFFGINLLQPLQPNTALGHTTGFGNEEFKRFLGFMMRSCSSLRDASFEFSPLDALNPHPEVLDNFITSAFELKSLTVKTGQISPQAWLHLQALERLTSLTLIWGRPSLPSLNMHCSVTDFGKVFPSLTSLALSLKAIDEMIPFLGALESPLSLLHLLYIDADLPSNKEANIPLLFHAISRFSRLQDLSVEMDFDIFDPFLSPRDVLPLIFPLANLQSVHLELLHVKDIDEDLLADVADAWPKLRVLKLEMGHPEYDPRPKLSLHSVVPLLQKCNHLERLHLAIDCKPIFISPSLVGLNYTLKNLIFSWNSRIEEGDVPSILRCLNLMMPRVQSIEGQSWKDIDDFDRGWDAFNDLAKRLLKHVV